MQCIKEASTLRVGTKKEKPAPRIVYRNGSQSSQIKEFLKHRRVIKDINRKVSISTQNECKEKLEYSVSIEREEDYPLRVVNLQSQG
jgi:hypothetical protein